MRRDVSRDSSRETRDRADEVSVPSRRILHVDMDAFYAAVEQRDRPELRGRPVIVGGSPDSRGVVCTASYEARRFGVHSALPAAQAKRLCPDGVFLRPDFERYQAASRAIHEIFRRYTDLVEPLSLDEAYLDVSVNKRGIESGTWVAEAIRRDVFKETGLTCSAGVAPNKFVAKVASDLRKPDGLVVIPPSEVRAFVRALPVRKVPGIGPVTERACIERGIVTCGDFLRHDEARLAEWFGRSGRHFARLARGEDNRPVVADSERKSCSIEDTFPRDLRGLPAIEAELQALSRGLSARMQRHAILGKTLTLKVRFSDFRIATRSRTLFEPTGDEEEILITARDLLQSTEAITRPIRLLGIGFSHLVADHGLRQGTLPFGGPIGGNDLPETGAAVLD